MFPAILTILGDLAPRLGCLYAASKMHKYILTGILHAPNHFYDTTPIGRILSRFSKDIDVIDNTLPQQLISTLGSSFKVTKTHFEKKKNKMIGTGTYVCVID